ncbi:MAG: 3'-5' exonuclease [Candidatus Peribacteria bacterium]|nr:MAG: 3'-5' exonuclease [Candidatus Peribacteria bacterium]
MVNKVNLSNVLFVDIECVPQYPSFYDLEDGLKHLRERKATRLADYLITEVEMDSAEMYDNRSGIYAEFGKVIVISVGYFAQTPEGTRQFRIKSFAGDDEKRLLMDFFELLNAHYSKNYHQLCGHNIREFDVPYICRRATVHGLELPSILDISTKKPREVNHLDTLEMWKFGDRKNFVSLDLLCRVMDVQTPKTDITGEQVARAYWDDQQLERIKEYCERDVLAVAELLLKFMRSEEVITDVQSL